jgi:DNA-binding response OmpR family regulator
MLSSTKKVQSSLPSLARTSILLVSPHSEDQATLQKILQPRGGTVARCSSVEEAATQMGNSSADLVLCESDLPDGSWKSMLATCESLPNSPRLLVVSRYADERLWAEVLNLGGYDVLLKPFEPMEVTRVVAAATMVV